MNKSALLAAVVAFSIAASPAFAAEPKSYQVTGPVVAVGDDSITVQKGSEKWEIAKGEASVPEDVKVGSKVTVQYTMSATAVTAKEGKHPAKASGNSKVSPSPSAAH